MVWGHIFDMKQRIHPNSLANLSREGRPLAYDEPKRIRSVSVTSTGWTGLQETAQSMGLSTSELLEQLGRGDLMILPAEATEAGNSIA